MIKKHRADKAWCFLYIYIYIYINRDLGIIAVSLGVVCFAL